MECFAVEKNRPPGAVGEPDYVLFAIGTRLGVADGLVAIGRLEGFKKCQFAVGCVDYRVEARDDILLRSRRNSHGLARPDVHRFVLNSIRPEDVVGKRVAVGVYRQRVTSRIDGRPVAQEEVPPGPVVQLTPVAKPRIERSVARSHEIPVHPVFQTDLPLFGSNKIIGTSHGAGVDIDVRRARVGVIAGDDRVVDLKRRAGIVPFEKSDASCIVSVVVGNCGIRHGKRGLNAEYALHISNPPHSAR